MPPHSPFNPSPGLAHIAQARLAIMQTGLDVGAGWIAPWIERFWQRCLNFWMQPHNPVVFGPVFTAQARLSLQAKAFSLADEALALQTGPNIAPALLIRDVEASMIQKAVDAARGNIAQAARALGINRATLDRKLGQKSLSPCP